MTVDYLPTPSKDYCRGSFLLPESHLYPGKVTVKHWQLRDLVNVSQENPHEVLYPCENIIHGVDLRDGKPELVCEFSFAPRCVKEHKGIIAVGGVLDAGAPGGSARGLFGICNRETQELLTTRIGLYINNSISMYSKGNNCLNAIICNNDCSLYTVNISPSAIHKTGEILMPCALNHASMSPTDGMIIACGDSSDIFIKYKNSRMTNAPDKILSTPGDSGFSTAFHSSGMLFAAAFQDGRALVYDVRNLTGPLHEVKSTRFDNQRGAFRCCKFVDGSEDFLLLSEQVGRVHIIDSSDFSKHQVVMFPLGYGKQSGPSSGSSGSSGTVRFDDDAELRHMHEEAVPDRRPAREFLEPIVRSYEDAIEYYSKQSLIPSHRMRGAGSPGGFRRDIGGVIAGHDERGERGERVERAERGDRGIAIIRPSDSGFSRRRNIPEAGGAGGRSYSRTNIGVDFSLNAYRSGMFGASRSSQGSYRRYSSIEPASSRPSSLFLRPPSSFTHRRSYSHDPENNSAMDERELYSQSDVEISGICWSSFDGGNFIVGTDRGITRWRIDRLARHCFGSFAFR